MIPNKHLVCALRQPSGGPCPQGEPCHGINAKMTTSLMVLMVPTVGAPTRGVPTKGWRQERHVLEEEGLG